jgi:RNA polymerase subunit RPABC4/transcription elongation factor Spt4
MSDVSQSKTCPLCAETIKAAAKVCPFCRAQQSRFAIWREQLVLVISAFVMMAVLGLVCYWVFEEKFASKGRSFVRHRSELRVLRTSLEREKKKPKFWLTGYVTNSGNYPWRVRELELRLVDAQGGLLDVHHPSVSDPFVVPPGMEGAFRVGLGELVFTNSVVVPQVRVQAASDGNLPANPD